jgi:hypothetical protein
LVCLQAAALVEQETKAGVRLSRNDLDRWETTKPTWNPARADRAIAGCPWIDGAKWPQYKKQGQLAFAPPSDLILTPRFVAVSSVVLLRQAASDLVYTTRRFWPPGPATGSDPLSGAAIARCLRHPSALFSGNLGKQLGAPAMFPMGAHSALLQKCAVLHQARVCRCSILSRDSDWPRRDRMHLMGLLDCLYHLSSGLRVTTDMDRNRLPRECGLRQWSPADRSVSNTQAGLMSDRGVSFPPFRNAGNDTRLAPVGRICLVPFIGNAAARERREQRERTPSGWGSRNDSRSALQ